MHAVVYEELLSDYIILTIPGIYKVLRSSKPSRLPAIPLASVATALESLCLIENELFCNLHPIKYYHKVGYF